MSETRKLICVNCPMGCALTVTLEGGKVQAVAGSQCARGVAYAEAECVNPTRTLTTTVPVDGGELDMLPVRTRVPVPKHAIMACMERLRGVRAKAPVRLGDVVAADIAGTGVDIVATRSVEKA